MEKEKKEQLIEEVEVPTGATIAYKYKDREMNLSQLILEMANDIKIIKRSVS